MTYHTTAAAASSATLVVTPADTTLPPAQVVLTGHTAGQFLAAGTQGLAFDAVDVGAESGAKTVAVTNVTGTTLTVAGVVSSDRDFIIDPTSMIGELPPGTTGTFRVSFGPTTAGMLHGEARVYLAGAQTPEVVVALDGVGMGTGAGGAQPPSGGCRIATGRANGGGAAFLVLACLIGAAAMGRRTYSRGPAE